MIKECALVTLKICLTLIQAVKGSRCPDGWSYYKCSCYQINPVIATLTGAVEKCKPHKLVSILTEDEAVWINSRVQETWIGLNVVNGQYVWDDGNEFESKLPMRRTGGARSLGCYALKGETIYFTECGVRKPFICKKMISVNDVRDDRTYQNGVFSIVWMWTDASCICRVDTYLSTSKQIIQGEQKREAHTLSVSFRLQSCDESLLTRSLYIKTTKGTCLNTTKAYEDDWLIDGLAVTDLISDSQMDVTEDKVIAWWATTNLFKLCQPQIYLNIHDEVENRDLRVEYTEEIPPMNSLVYTGISRCTNYSVTFAMETKNKLYIMNKTNIEVPPIVSPLAGQYSLDYFYVKDQFRVSWTTDVPPSCLCRYKLKIKANEWLKSFETTGNEVAVDIKTCGVYQASLDASSGPVCDNEEVIPSQRFTLPLKGMASLVNSSQFSFTGRSVVVTWLMNTLEYECKIDFLVDIQKNNSTHGFKINLKEPLKLENTIAFDHMESCQNYTLLLLMESGKNKFLVNKTDIVHFQLPKTLKGQYYMSKNYRNGTFHVSWGWSSENGESKPPCFCQYELRMEVHEFKYLVRVDNEFAEIKANYCGLYNITLFVLYGSNCLSEEVLRDSILVPQKEMVTKSEMYQSNGSVYFYWEMIEELYRCDAYFFLQIKDLISETTSREIYNCTLKNSNLMSVSEGLRCQPHQIDLLYSTSTGIYLVNTTTFYPKMDESDVQVELIILTEEFDNIYFHAKLSSSYKPQCGCPFTSHLYGDGMLIGERMSDYDENEIMVTFQYPSNYSQFAVGVSQGIGINCSSSEVIKGYWEMVPDYLVFNDSANFSIDFMDGILHVRPLGEINYGLDNRTVLVTVIDLKSGDTILHDEPTNSFGELSLPGDSLANYCHIFKIIISLYHRGRIIAEEHYEKFWTVNNVDLETELTTDTGRYQNGTAILSWNVSEALEQCMEMLSVTVTYVPSSLCWMMSPEQRAAQELSFCKCLCAECYDCLKTPRSYLQACRNYTRGPFSVKGVTYFQMDDVLDCQALIFTLHVTYHGGGDQTKPVYVAEMEDSYPVVTTKIIPTLSQFIIQFFSDSSHSCHQLMEMEVHDLRNNGRCRINVPFIGNETLSLECMDFCRPYMIYLWNESTPLTKFNYVQPREVPDLYLLAISSSEGLVVMKLNYNWNSFKCICEFVMVGTHQEGKNNISVELSRVSVSQNKYTYMLRAEVKQSMWITLDLHFCSGSVFHYSDQSIYHNMTIIESSNITYLRWFIPFLLLGLFLSIVIALCLEVRKRVQQANTAPYHTPYVRFQN